MQQHVSCCQLQGPDSPHRTGADVSVHADVSPGVLVCRMAQQVGGLSGRACCGVHYGAAMEGNCALYPARQGFGIMLNPAYLIVEVRTLAFLRK